MIRTNYGTEILDKDITTIFVRNFAGQPDNFSRNGYDKGFFMVGLTEAKGHELEEQGFDIRWRDDRDGNPRASLKVFVSYNFREPTIHMVNGRTGDDHRLTKENVACLDTAELVEVNLVITKSSRPYDFNGRQGYSSYLSSGTFVIEDDRPVYGYSGDNDSAE